MSCLFWLSSILIVTQNFALSRGILVEKWIEQYQDHFDYYNGKTWSMRYYENDEFYYRSGPIFILIGGESEIAPDNVGATSFVYEMAAVHGGMIYYTEHRYYGRSHPVPDAGLENLRYLSVSQALADIALFIRMKKKELNNPDAFTMVFGYSYAGNLAAWMRVGYPHLVQGALADSAPIYAKTDFVEFFASVENSIRKYDENCATNIEEAFSAVEELLDRPTVNSIKVKNDFKLSNPEFSQSFEVSYMMLRLTSIFAHAVLYNRIEMNGEESIENLCMSMRENEAISSYYRLAEVYKKHSENSPLLRIDYKLSITNYRRTSWEYQLVKRRLWMYQVCTELGYFKTLSSPASVFGCRLPLQYFMDECRDIFGAGFDQDYLDHNIREINRLYNSKLPNTTNVIFINGDLDPWRSLSVVSDLNADSPAILINGASHCQFMLRRQAPQKGNIISARCRVSFIIHEWLHK